MKELTREAMRFEETGQERPPRRGEWYMGMLGAPALAPKDFAMRCLPILRRASTTGRARIWRSSARGWTRRRGRRPG